jgi:hypothetical protein
MQMYKRMQRPYKVWRIAKARKGIANACFDQIEFPVRNTVKFDKQQKSETKKVFSVTRGWMKFSTFTVYVMSCRTFSKTKQQIDNGFK